MVFIYATAIAPTFVNQVLAGALNDPNEALVQYLVELRSQLLWSKDTIFGAIIHQSFEFDHFLAFDGFNALS